LAGGEKFWLGVTPQSIAGFAIGSLQRLC